MRTKETRPTVTAAFRARAAPVASLEPTGEGGAAKRALAQTREALSSGEIAKAGARAAQELELSLAGKPERGDPGEVVARVVAVGDRRTRVPAVPLEGVPARLKVDGKVIAEDTTDLLGMVTLRFADPGDVSYEVEVLGADCAVLACQHGRAAQKAGSDSHLIELPRTNALKPQLERAQPLEEAIRAARDRAAIGEEVMKKALVAQERRLIAYLAVLEGREGESAKGDRPARGDIPVKPDVPAKNDARVKGDGFGNRAEPVKRDLPGATKRPSTPARTAKPKIKRGGKKKP